MARTGGNPALRDVRNTDTTAANGKRRKLADEYAMKTAELLREASRQYPSMLHVDYADWLNDNNWPTRKGGRWTATQVGRVFKRFGLAASPKQKKRGIRQYVQRSPTPAE